MRSDEKGVVRWVLEEDGAPDDCQRRFSCDRSGKYSRLWEERVDIGGRKGTRNGGRTVGEEGGKKRRGMC